MTAPYAGDITKTAELVAQLEAAGLDQVSVPEAYSMDAISASGYLAAKTHRVELGTGILNVFSRTPALLGMTAAGCDVTGGRFFLGLGASGPQVIEGFHAVPYDKPLARTRETIEIVRQVLRREVVRLDGLAHQLALEPVASHELADPALRDAVGGRYVGLGLAGVDGGDNETTFRHAARWPSQLGR